MGVDYSSFILLPNFDFWSRPVTITPLKSQGSNVGYGARGIYDSREIEYLGDGGVVISDQQTILDIREVEFTVLPAQGDLVSIGPDTDLGGMTTAPGNFEIIDRSHNGGGEVTLILRKLEPATP